MGFLFLRVSCPLHAVIATTNPLPVFARHFSGGLKCPEFVDLPTTLAWRLSLRGEALDKAPRGLLYRMRINFPNHFTFFEPLAGETTFDFRYFRLFAMTCLFRYLFFSSPRPFAEIA